MTSQTFTFIHYAFDASHRPQLVLLPEGASEFVHLQPLGQQLTLVFDTGKRYCIGWHRLRDGQSFPCPDGAIMLGKFDTCRHCQQKTGFNPAFYNTDNISAQQKARNAEPHILYIAHFAPGVMKIGISWAQRGIKRLLDQGARSGLIIKTFPTADAARKVEAQAVQLPGFVETMRRAHKQLLLKSPYDHERGAEELLAARQRLTTVLGITPDDHSPMHLDPHYLHTPDFAAHKAVDIANEPAISGLCIGMIGGLYLAAQDNTPFILPLHPYTGHRVTISTAPQPNSHAPAQMSLL